MGLLVPADVDPENGYRRYRESQLATARLIVMLRRLDMPLTQVADIISVPGPEAAERLATYWNAFEKRVASQRELASHLRSRLSGREEPLGLSRCPRERRSRAARARRAAARPGRGIAGWIGAAMARLAATARDHGGVAGHPFVVYYGEVNEDSDGPAEACVPIAPTVGLERGTARRGATHAMRFEPAHREAYVRLRKVAGRVPADSQRLRRRGAMGRREQRRDHRRAARDLLRRLQIGRPRRRGLRRRLPGAVKQRRHDADPPESPARRRADRD